MTKSFPNNKDIDYETQRQIYYTLEEQLKAEGRVVISASNLMKYAFEGETIKREAKFSSFTEVMVHGLETWKADLDEDGSVTVSELYRYLRTFIDNDPVFAVRGDHYCTKTRNWARSIYCVRSVDGK